MINPTLQVRKLSPEWLSNWPNVVNHGARIHNEPILLTFLQPLLDLPSCPVLQMEKLRPRYMKPLTPQKTKRRPRKTPGDMTGLQAPGSGGFL